jgi:F0F1-type ATP synthase membrane subunit c/vacuolar-type H+-ATPase subunit K
MNQQSGIVWSVLLVSQLIYLILPLPASDSTTRLPEVFPAALGFVAFTQAVAIVAALRVRAIQPIRAGLLDPTSETGAANLFVTLLICWVLAESIAIFGLVLRFLHFEWMYSFPFAVAGALLMLIARPWQAGLKPPRSLADQARTGTPIS